MRDLDELVFDFGELTCHHLADCAHCAKSIQKHVPDYWAEIDSLIGQMRAMQAILRRLDMDGKLETIPSNMLQRVLGVHL